MHVTLTPRLISLLSRAALLVLMGAAAAGCSTLRGTPPRYSATEEIVTAIDLSATDLAALVTVDSLTERNALQNRAIAVIDLRFHQFVRDLSADRADAATAAAGTTLGASTAGAFVSSVTAKTHYALFAAGVVGAFGIMDKSYFYEKTVPALVAAMGAARATVLLRIRSSQADAVTAYTGAAALQDLEEYFAAGTVLAGIAEATASAERDKKAALDEVRVLDVPDDAEIDRRKTLTKATFAIKDQAGMDRGNQALKALGAASQVTPKDTGLALRRAMRPPTDERLRAVEKALRDAGLLQ